MNTTQSQKGENLISIQINVVKEDYEPQVKKELNKLQHKAQVPGFRPGMVPFGMIKKMYGAQATIEVLNSLVSETLNNYILENKLDLIGYPLSDPDHQTPVDFEKQDSLDFFFEAALRPEIKVDYSKCKIDFAHVIADDAAIDKTVNELVERNPEITHPETVGENDVLELKVREAEDGKELEDGFKELGITIDKDHPVHIELSYPSSVNQYANRANALKKSVETSTDGAIIVDLLDCVSLKNWYYDGYYTQSGDQCNYNVYDCSGWGPDYGDPQTYLNTFQKEIGDMIHVLGIY